MHKQLLKFPLAVLLLILLYHNCISQSLVPDSFASPAYKNTVTYYNQSLSEELHLFNGKENKEYPNVFSTGTPYFISNNWSKGTMNYDGKMYENVSLLYDVVKDEVVNLYFNNISRVQLAKEKVLAFSIRDHNFIHITPDSLRALVAPGFYDELYHGKTSLLAKRTKNIQSFIHQSGEEFKVFSKDHYYVRKGGDYFPVSNKKSFLRTLGDKRKVLQQYIRQNKLNFRKDKENAMKKTLEYFDQIINA